MNKKETVNKGLEKLLFDGVHPDCIGKQHSSWKNSWVSVQELNERNENIYNGLFYVYFVDKETGLLYCFNSLKEAENEFDSNKHVPVEVSCYECHIVEDLRISI